MPVPTRAARAIAGGFDWATSMTDDHCFTALLEGLSEAALIASTGRILAANRAARELLVTESEAAGPGHRAPSPPSTRRSNSQDTDAADGVELTGLGGSRRHWLMRSAALSTGRR